MIRLRPHHLLCIRGFRGKGYSEAFVRNMREVIGRLNEDAGQTVEMVSGADDICRCCPHLTDEGICDQNEKVSAYDRRTSEVFDLYAIQAGDARGSDKNKYGRCGYAELQGKIDVLFDPDRLEAVCGGCRWAGLCRDALSELS